MSGTVSATHLHIYIPKAAQMFRSNRPPIGRLPPTMTALERRGLITHLQIYFHLMPQHSKTSLRHLFFRAWVSSKNFFPWEKKIQNSEIRRFENPGVDAWKFPPPPLFLLLLLLLMPSLSLMRAHWLICRGAKWARCQYGCKFVSVQIFF